MSETQRDFLEYCLTQALLVYEQAINQRVRSTYRAQIFDLQRHIRQESHAK